MWRKFYTGNKDVNAGNKKPPLEKAEFGGEYRVRTGDLLHAMQALYQLS